MKTETATPKNYAAWLSYWAKRQAEKPCMFFGERGITYGAMEKEVAAYGEKFRELSFRQTVLIVKSSPLAQAIAFLAAERAGWVPVLGHPDLSKEAAVLLGKKRNIGWLDGETLQEITPDGLVPAASICMGVLSSGSTGLPKLLFRTYASWADFFPEQNAMFQVNRDTVAFGEGSLSFTGNANLWASVLFAGATMVFGQGLHPHSWMMDLTRYHVTVLYLVPVKLKLLLQAAKEIMPTVRTILAGSQLLEAGTARALHQYFPKSQIVLYYGASEVDYVTWLTYEELLQHPMSVGRPCPGVGVTIRDGLIIIDTPYHVEGLPQPCTLQDRGYFDEEGYLIFLGRQGQVVNKGGLTISCNRVEQAVQQVPGVLDAAVVPLQDKARGETLGAVVVLEKGMTIQTIRKALRTMLLPGELPGRWAVVPALPLSGAGKVDCSRVQDILRSSQNSIYYTQETQ